MLIFLKNVVNVNFAKVARPTFVAPVCTLLQSNNQVILSYLVKFELPKDKV